MAYAGTPEEVREKWREAKRLRVARQRAAGTYKTAKKSKAVIAAKKRRQYARNPEPFLMRMRQRYQWLKAGDVTAGQLREIWERGEGRCTYCGILIAQPRFDKHTPRGFDHVIPMVKGGQHTASNIVVCCQPCNSKKSAN